MREYDKNIIFMNVHLHATDAVTHIHEIATGHIRIKWGQTVYEFDYRYLYDPLQIGWFPPPLHELLSVDGNMNFNGLGLHFVFIVFIRQINPFHRAEVSYLLKNLPLIRVILYGPKVNRKSL